MSERPDPFQSLAREVLRVLAAEGRPMRMRDLQARIGDGVARQLSVARVAGFVRSTAVGRELAPAYEPTPVGMLVAHGRPGGFSAASVPLGAGGERV